ASRRRTRVEIPEGNRRLRDLSRPRPRVRAWECINQARGSHARIRHVSPGEPDRRSVAARCEYLPEPARPLPVQRMIDRQYAALRGEFRPRRVLERLDSLVDASTFREPRATG